MSDLHFDRALRAAARRGRPDGVCPDAAALAAYVDRSLSPTERARLEAHVASCPACTEHLALLAAVDSPEPADGLAGLSLARLFGHWRWLVPAVSALLVVAIWLRPPASRQTASPASADMTAPASTRAANAASDSASPDATANKTAEKPAAPAPVAAPAAEERERTDGFAGSRARLNARQLEGAKKKPEEMAQAQAKTLDALADKERDEKGANERQKMADVTATAPAPANVPEPTRVAETKADADVSAGARAPMASTPPAAEAVPIAPAQQGAVGGAVALRKAAVVSPLLITGPGVRIRALGGRLERSADDGATWTVERTGVASRMLSGTCPTSDACWVGGDDGVVFVRVSDRTWIERRVPDVHIPILAIAATSANAATLTLADGRRLTTSDNGRTWIPIP
jgi:anti-sigma factor RsiW